MLKIILSGCLGKVGQAIVAAVKDNDEFEICAGVDKMAANAQTDFPVYSDIAKCQEKADVIIDFSRPEALPPLLRYAQQHKLPMVLASTGYNQNDIRSIEYASENIPILRSSNMSLGINLLKDLAAKASAILNSTYDIEIIEKHHNTKVDAPSGTAIMLADAINDAAGGDLEYIYDRHERRCARPKRELGLHAIRGGTITGEHTILFAGQDEVVELTHQAYSRRIYAVGALRAAQFICNLPCGLYDMSSLLTQQQIITHAYASESDVLITVSSIKDPALVNNIFIQLKDAEIIIDIISQPTPVNGLYTLSISVPKNLADKAYRIIKDLASSEETVELIDDIAKLTVEGSGMAHHAGATGQVIGILSELSIPILLITTSETKITCCIPKLHASKALSALKACFTTEGENQ